MGAPVARWGIGCVWSGCVWIGRFGMRRSLLVLGAVLVMVVALVPGVAAAGDPIPPTGRFIAEDIDASPDVVAIPRYTISESASGTSLVRTWFRINRAVGGGCPLTQGPANAAAVATWDAATGKLSTTSETYWCQEEDAVQSGNPSVLTYDEVNDEIDGGITYRRVARPIDVGLVDTAQGLWRLDTGMGTYKEFFYGNPGDYPILGDWDCDGVDTPGMYRQSDGYVYLRNSNTQGIGEIRFFFGNPGDIPITGDFNDDGCDTVSIFRPSESRVFIINELGENEGGLGAAEFDYYFGNPGDKPFVGDFDGDGVDTIGLHRESTGLVYFRNSHTQGNADNQFIYGDPNDRLVAADWIDTGIDTPALFRPSNTTFYLRYTNTQGVADDVFTWGTATSVPVAGHFGTLSDPLCDASYPGQCIPPAPPDLNCADIATTDFTVVLPDLHGFDGNNNGIGCE